MLATAAAELGFDVHIYTPEEDSPASRVAAKTTVAPYTDLAAVTAFAAAVDAVTLEFENIPVETLAACAKATPVRPGTKSLAMTQDRSVEKRFIASLGLATAPFADVATEAELSAALKDLGCPAILKSRRFGYDGKGQALIKTPSDSQAALAQMAGHPAILEGFVAFEREISVIIARGTDNAMTAFPVTQNEHRAGILRRSTAPAPIAEDTAKEATSAAATIAEALDHVGVLAVEFFLEPGGKLRVNEIAPRVHNSGHWTQDAGGVSQFEQHIRAVAGWPLRTPHVPRPAVVMHNLIGEDAADWRAWASKPNAQLHLYGKREQRAGRKMGHVTTPAED
jgi:5-(carboxyamino)imidazole ribonucleotide synthase